MHTLKAAGLYFALVFGSGFVLGTIRVLLIVPIVGTRTAELLEAPLMLVVIILAARWVVRYLDVPPTAANRLGMGGVAVALILTLEFALVFRIRGPSFSQYVEAFDPVTGIVYFVMLAVFAIMPFLLAWAGRQVPHGYHGRLLES